ncbi:aminopeptidase P family protein [Xanthomonas sp. XNM01]|uniref:aminopeptidase P family protein n=1 Tax=Xanthomonas sp. XNM01 TaxID=2769289 RepID=UPI00177FB828|nr:aminopeptidase P family protein [Xanthomonas sp. XNM01]MBD9370340.1 aminopeptidase P family protein [Xanthomonas sp. XNM01]
MSAPGIDTPATRIARLRAAMRDHGIDALLVPTADPHLSEYLPPRWQARAWLSGFDGSAGTLVVGLEQAALFVDSRYTALAQRQLDGSGIAVIELPASRAPVWIDWMCGLAGAGGRIAVDGQVLARRELGPLQAAATRHRLQLETALDLVDAVWQTRPTRPSTPLLALPDGVQGHDRARRLAWVRERMQLRGTGWHLLSSLDDIAWLLGLRGADVDYNPVFLAHLLIGPEQAWLYVDAARLTPPIDAALRADGVVPMAYAGIEAALSALPASTRLLVDPVRTTAGLLQHCADGVALVEATNPSQLLKAVKSPAEIAALRTTMEHDGAALCRALCRLDALLADRAALTELDIDTLLAAERARQPGYVGPSFATIAGFNGNGAMPHYRATPGHHAAIAGDGLLLVDSGGQYHGGTTDITRMVAVGMPTPQQRQDSTRVLKGMIALSSAHFPDGIRAPLLDAIARAPLWKHGLDYGHGTGHGVGWFLNVHEGPQSFSYRGDAHADTAMRAGMVTSVEPGLYRDGQWGVRWENLVLAVPAGEAGFGDFLRFETLTLCPLDLRCIDVALLDADEIEWIDAYHAQVRARLLPLLEGEAAAWMQRVTAALRR